MDIEEFLMYLQSYYGSQGKPRVRGGVTQPNKMRVPIFDTKEGFARESPAPPPQPQQQQEPGPSDIMQMVMQGMQQSGMGGPQMGGMPQQPGMMPQQGMGGGGQDAMLMEQLNAMGGGF